MIDHQDLLSQWVRQNPEKETESTYTDVTGMLKDMDDRARKADLINAIHEFVWRCQTLICRKWGVAFCSFEEALQESYMSWEELNEELQLPFKDATALLNMVDNISFSRLEPGFAPVELTNRLVLKTCLLNLADEYLSLYPEERCAFKGLLNWSVSNVVSENSTLFEFGEKCDHIFETTEPPVPFPRERDPVESTASI